MREFISKIKHAIIFGMILSTIGLLAFTLESSEINNLQRIEILGNKYLDSDLYINYAQLDDLEKISELAISIIKDRLEKHPYIEYTDVQLLDRGIIQIKIFEKNMDAVLISNSHQLLITDQAEIIPMIESTRNIDLPVIVNNTEEKYQVFDNANRKKNLLCALKVISTAELYDSELYNNISEIDLQREGYISLHLSKFDSPILLGNKNEIEKTVFLSKIFKHMQGNDLTEYLDYVDLRYDELVYLGFDERLTTDKEKI